MEAGGTLKQNLINILITERGRKIKIARNGRLTEGNKEQVD